jgi:hypothetical protein
VLTKSAALCGANGEIPIDREVTAALCYEAELGVDQQRRVRRSRTNSGTSLSMAARQAARGAWLAAEEIDAYALDADGVRRPRSSSPSQLRRCAGPVA